MVQLLTWEWLARDILFQLANDRCIGLPWRRSGRVMVYWMSRDTTTIWDWDWTAWESPRPVHCIHTSRAFVSTSGLKKEFKGKREIDPVFPCHGGGGGTRRPVPYIFCIPSICSIHNLHEDTCTKFSGFGSEIGICPCILDLPLGKVTLKWRTLTGPGMTFCRTDLFASLCRNFVRFWCEVMWARRSHRNLVWQTCICICEGHNGRDWANVSTFV